jgi:uncharacterized protein DUF4340
MSRATLAMVAVFALLAGVAFAVEKTQPAIQPENATVYALDIKDTDIQRLDVVSATGSAAFDRAEPFGWQFASGDAADLSRVSSVINRLAKLRSSAKVTDKLPGDLSPYGLAPAPITTTLTMKDGSSKVVRFGSKTPNDAAYYVMVEGSGEMHTVNTLLVGDIEKLVTDPPLPSPTTTPAAAVTPRGTPTLPPGEGEPPQAEGTPTPTIGLPAPSLN